MSFIDQIAAAKAHIRACKKTIPHLFPQWQELQSAKDDLEKAKARYEAAKAAWKELGKESP